MNSGGNPKALLQQFLGNANQEQVKGVIQNARKMGCPDNILAEIQNLNTKK